MAIWTADALRSELRPAAGACWRLVEAQHRVSTLKLVDGLAEQAVLEGILEQSKPRVPRECAVLDYLLYAPFRYGSYPFGSRFRRQGQTLGVFYASERVATAIAETAFNRLLFFAESPATPWPKNALEFSAIEVSYAAVLALDLSTQNLSQDAHVWQNLTEYGPCQELADAARDVGAMAIRYVSVRDREHGANCALLTCRAFSKKAPVSRQHWQIHFGPNGVVAFGDNHAQPLAFDTAAFAADPRISAIAWNR